MSNTKMEALILMLKSIKRMRFVHRSAGVPCVHNQNLMEHGFRTAILFYLFSKAKGKRISASDLFYVLMHDVLETETGDLLWPAKHKGNNEDLWATIEQEIVSEKQHLKEFTDDHFKKDQEKQRLFKETDMLEFALTCLEEIELGNASYEIKKGLNTATSFLRDEDIKYLFHLLSIE